MNLNIHCNIGQPFHRSIFIIGRMIKKYTDKEKEANILGIWRMADYINNKKKYRLISSKGNRSKDFQEPFPRSTFP